MECCDISMCNVAILVDINNMILKVNLLIKIG